VTAAGPERQPAALPTIHLAGHDFIALEDGALYWPLASALIVADLHLEKASWYAAGGQMLPPYDSAATLERLETVIAQLDPASVWVLGDSFHDADGPGRLDPALQARVATIAARRHLVWVAGNHDGAGAGVLGGSVVTEMAVAGVTMRHAADATEAGPELSGHYHPKWRVPGRGRRLSRRCFVAGRNRIILPAFGALAGGMDANAPEILALTGRPATACVPISGRLLEFPLF